MSEPSCYRISEKRIACNRVRGGCLKSRFHSSSYRIVNRPIREVKQLMLKEKSQKTFKTNDFLLNYLKIPSI